MLLKTFELLTLIRVPWRNKSRDPWRNCLQSSPFWSFTLHYERKHPGAFSQESRVWCAEMRRKCLLFFITDQTEMCGLALSWNWTFGLTFGLILNSYLRPHIRPNCCHYFRNLRILRLSPFSFSALTLLVGWQEGHPACKTLDVGLLMVIWLELCTSNSSSCHHSPPPSSLAPMKPRMESLLSAVSTTSCRIIFVVHLGVT